MTIKLAEIKKRCEAATPGPWYFSCGCVRCQPEHRYEPSSGVVVVENDPRDIIAEMPLSNSDEQTQWQRGNISFIKYARADLPALVDWAERAKAFLENYFKGSVRAKPLSAEEISANIQSATNEGLQLLREID